MDDPERFIAIEKRGESTVTVAKGHTIGDLVDKLAAKDGRASAEQDGLLDWDDSGLLGGFDD